jgi:endo-1,4-beta-xylanase
MPPNRREYLALVAAFCAARSGVARADTLPLRSIAEARGLLYGAAVSSRRLREDNSYKRLLTREAGILVAEGETKRSSIQPNASTFDFSGTDYILDFASQNNQSMRGHTLIWHRSNPRWLELSLVQKRSDRLITDYIQMVVKRYAGRFHSWDVVNEAIEPDNGHFQGLRTDSIWFKAFGEEYIDIAFHAARAADPHVPLYYNETNIESDVPWADRRRKATLGLLERLIKRGVPIDGLGVQGHLKMYKLKFSDRIFSRFLDDVASMGLKILITEFDVADIGGPNDPAKRDADTAGLTRDFLSAAFANRSVLGCLTWGISDKYSWLSEDSNYRWADHQISRVLPFDADFKPKPMRNAIAECLDRGTYTNPH